VHRTIETEHCRRLRRRATVAVAAVAQRRRLGSENGYLWSALGSQLKPELDVLVTVTVDAAALASAGSPAEGIDVYAHRGVNR
jgi:hypothetical protein